MKSDIPVTITRPRGNHNPPFTKESPNSTTGGKLGVVFFFFEIQLEIPLEIWS